MPPSQTPNSFTPPPIPKKGMSFGKLSLLVLLLVLLGVALAISVLYVFGFWGILLGTAVKDDATIRALSAQVEASADIVVSTYQCSESSYSWRIISRDEVIGGSSFEGFPPEIADFRIPVLLKDGEIIVEGNKEQTTANSSFPVAGNFLKTYVAGREVFNSGDPSNEYWIDKRYRYIDMPTSAVSTQDFDLIADCLKAHKLQLDADLAEGPAFYNGPIGWLTFFDPAVLENPQYICSDESIAMVVEGRTVYYYPSGSVLGAGYVKPLEKGRWVTVDGKVHSETVYSPAYPGGLNPQDELKDCKDSTGKTLIDFIKSVPERLGYLD